MTVPTKNNTSANVAFIPNTSIPKTWQEITYGDKFGATGQRTQIENAAKIINDTVRKDPPVSTEEKTALSMVKKNFDAYVANVNASGQTGIKLQYVIYNDFFSYYNLYFTKRNERIAIEKEFDKTRQDIEKIRKENATLESNIVKISEQKRLAIQSLPQVLIDKKAVIGKLYEQKLAQEKVIFTKKLLAKKQDFDEKFTNAAKQKNLQITAAINTKLMGG